MRSTLRVAGNLAVPGIVPARRAPVIPLPHVLLAELALEAQIKLVATVGDADVQPDTLFRKLVCDILVRHRESVTIYVTDNEVRHYIYKQMSPRHMPYQSMFLFDLKLSPQVIFDSGESVRGFVLTRKNMCELPAAEVARSLKSIENCCRGIRMHG